jgi:hypothetical protein
MLVAHLGISPAIVNSPVETAQVAPTILALLGLNPNSLIAVQKEGARSCREFSSRTTTNRTVASEEENSQV